MRTVQIRVLTVGLVFFTWTYERWGLFERAGDWCGRWAEEMHYR